MTSDLLISITKARIWQTTSLPPYMVWRNPLHKYVFHLFIPLLIYTFPDFRTGPPEALVICRVTGQLSWWLTRRVGRCAEVTTRSKMGSCFLLVTMLWMDVNGIELAFSYTHPRKAWIHIIISALCAFGRQKKVSLNWSGVDDKKCQKWYCRHHLQLPKPAIYIHEETILYALC